MFNILQKKVGNNEPNILVKHKFLKDGIQFNIYLEDKGKTKPIFFPIPYTKYFNLRNLVKKNFYLSLQIMEDLWNGGELKEDNNSYYIDVDSIYDLQEELIELLGFEKDENIKVEISSDLPVGTSKFSLSYSLYHPDYGYITNLNSRIGHFFPIDNNKKTFLLNKKLVELLDLIDNPPRDRNEQFQYLARIKSQGNKLGVSFDDYLKRENYYFPDELDAELEVKSNNHISLFPRFPELDEDLNKEAIKLLDNEERYGKRKTAEKNNRVFFSEEVARHYTKLKNNRDITGADVPRFIENPAPFLPDSFDLENFSDRVKGLKELVYQAHPYIAGQRLDRDWFDLKTGIKLTNENDETIKGQEDILTNDEFTKLVEEASKVGQDYVLWKNKWVKIPEDSAKFIEANRKVNDFIDGLQNGEHPGKIDKTRISYIFDIYENVDKLEYNLEMLELKEKLRKVDGLIYEKPSLLNGSLYSYQEKGYIWLNRLKIMSLGGLMADDMGLGKTIQIIAFMAKLKEIGQLKPSLVVAPATILENWKNELNKFCPVIRDIYIHHGGNRARNSNVLKNAEVVITTYSTLTRDQVKLGGIDWKVLICDEAQNIKNNSTMAAHAVKAQKAMIRLALTGTPIENGLGDLWSIVDYIQPGLLGSFKEFSKKFIKPIERCSSNEEFHEYENRLTSLIKPVYIRRTKEGELKEELPEKKEKWFSVKMSEKQEKMYKDIRKSQKVNNGNPLQALQSLIALCCHPGLITEDWKYKSIDELVAEGPKLKILIEILTDIQSKNEKAIIFTRRIKMQYIIQRVIREKFNMDYVPIINGDSKGRLQTVNRFNISKGFWCMILSPLAAGTGLNITGANHVIHYSRWWNPAVEQQATDRAYRIGQEKDVIVYYPISTSESFETVEKKLDQLLVEKKTLAQNIIVPNRKIENDIKNELLSMLTN